MLMPANKAKRDTMLSTRVPSAVKSTLAWFADEQNRSEAQLVVDLLYDKLVSLARERGLIFMEWRSKMEHEEEYSTYLCVFRSLLDRIWPPQNLPERDESKKIEWGIPIDLFYHLRQFGVAPSALAPGLYVFITDAYDPTPLRNEKIVWDLVKEELKVPNTESVSLALPVAKPKDETDHTLLESKLEVQGDSS